MAIRDFPWEMESKEKKGFLESIQALKLLPPFFRMIWKTSPRLTFWNIVLRLFKSAIPVGQLCGQTHH